MTTYSIYCVSNYRFGLKDEPNPRDNSTQGRLLRMKAEYPEKGMRRR